MKKVSLVCFLVFISIGTTFALDSTRFYAMPYVGLVPKTGQTAITLGGDVAYSPIYRVFIGISYQQVMNRFMPHTEMDQRKELTSQWGGIKFEYQLVNEEQYKLYTYAVTGMGVLDIVIDEEGVLPEEDETYGYVKLGLNFDMPIGHALSISLGWNYRFVSEIDYKNVEAADIGGFSGQLGLRYFINR